MIKSRESHLAAARYYIAIGMVMTATRHMAKAEKLEEQERETFKPTRRELDAMRREFNAYRYAR